MSSLTTNLGLKKPDGTDLFFKREDYNSNLDKIDEAINGIITLPNVRLQLSNPVHIPYNGVYIPWNQVIYDTSGMFDVSQPDRLICKVAGKYRISAGVAVTIAEINTSYTIKTQLFLKRNGTEIPLDVDNSLEYHTSIYQKVFTSFKLNVNDIIRVKTEAMREYAGINIFNNFQNTNFFCAECFELT